MLDLLSVRRCRTGDGSLEVGASMKRDVTATLAAILWIAFLLGCMAIAIRPQ